MMNMLSIEVAFASQEEYFIKRMCKIIIEPYNLHQSPVVGL